MAMHTDPTDQLPSRTAKNQRSKKKETIDDAREQSVEEVELIAKRDELISDSAFLRETLGGLSNRTVGFRRKHCVANIMQTLDIIDSQLPSATELSNVVGLQWAIDALYDEGVGRVNECLRNAIVTLVIDPVVERLPYVKGLPADPVMIHDNAKIAVVGTIALALGEAAAYDYVETLDEHIDQAIARVIPIGR